MVNITSNEVTSLKDFIRFNLLDVIRNNEDINSLLWVYNILNVYRKCGGFDEYSDYKEGQEIEDAI